MSRHQISLHHRRSVHGGLAAAIIVAALAGCGGDDGNKGSAAGSTGSSPAPAATSASAGALSVEGTPVADHGTKTVAGGQLSVELDDNYFKPTVIKGKAGSTVRLELENEGQAEHNFELEQQQIDKDVEAGAKATVTVKIPTSGRVTFYCKYHVSKGMGGALEASGS
jgi:plastocyanin